MTAEDEFDVAGIRQEDHQLRAHPQLDDFLEFLALGDDGLEDDCKIREQRRLRTASMERFPARLPVADVTGS